MNYSGMVRPLTALTINAVMFKLHGECQKIFKKLWKTFIMTSYSAYFDWMKELVLETDFSYWVLIDELSQHRDDGDLLFCFNH